MRIGFCGHPYHRATGSHRFFLEALADLGAIEEHWVVGADFDPGLLAGAGYDAIVVWQMERVALQLAETGLPNVTFFPMYDSCHAYPDSFWRRLGGLKIVSFSSALQARLQRLGVRTRFARYFPEVPPERAREVPELTGFFWQRQQDITWATLRELLGDAPFRRFTLHDALDPSHGRLIAPTPDEAERFQLRTTRWFPTQAEARADLLSHNVYFAPRLREGIGMSFLEAMALGFLVVAPDRPTMNEYITSGVNGLLYDPEAPAPLDFTQHQVMGQRARQAAAVGHERWLRMLPALLELVATPTRRVPVRAPLGALDPLSLDPDLRAPTRRTPSGSAPAVEGRTTPLVTVAVLDSRGGPAGRVATLDSVLAQDWPRLELLLQEGEAGQAAGDLARARESGVERARSLPASTGALALNEVADTAVGDFLLYLTWGERLATRDALSSALRPAPPDADLIVGKQLDRDEEGAEEICEGVDPARVYAALRCGRIGWRQIESLPAGSAVLWRAGFLRRLRFRADLPLLAQEEVVLRAVERGARVHHTLEPLAVRTVPRRSRRDRRRLLDAWLGIATRLTEDPDTLDRAFSRMHAEARTRELHRLPWAGLLLSLGRLPGAFREVKRRVRTRRALARAARLHASPPDRPPR